jgi:hypothetical protein
VQVASALEAPCHPIPGLWKGGCDEYCNQFFAFCQPPNGPPGYYKSYSECIDKCPSIPVPKGNAWGKLQNGNTMGCHTWHFSQGLSINTLSAFHCNHAFIDDPMLICANQKLTGYGKDMRQIVWDTHYVKSSSEPCNTCECNSFRTVISCGGLNLTQAEFVNLVAVMPVYVQTLDFSANEITSLPSNIFSKLTKLVGLDLAGNAIVDYQAGAFSGLTKLESLILDDNPESNGNPSITRTLPNGFLDELVNLKEFSIINNGITAWSSTLFKETTKLELAVLFGNPITGLPQGFLDTTPQLKLISIVGTPELPSDTSGFPTGVFDNLPNLLQLHVTLGPTAYDMTFNIVPEAVKTGLQKMPKLKGFVMWNAQYVTSLPEDLFYGNPVLDVAYLFNGGFTSFPENLFAKQTKLRVVGVDASQLPADCSFFTGSNYGTRARIHI